NDGVHGTELWKSDGTAEGTMLVADIVPGSLSSYPLYPTAVGGTLFFFTHNRRINNGDWTLWRSDGTSKGTVMVADITGYQYAYPRDFTGVKHALFFAMNDGVHGRELWRSDGTAAGTAVIDINPGPSGSYPCGLKNIDGTLYFAANDGIHGSELWKS